MRVAVDESQMSVLQLLACATRLLGLSKARTVRHRLAHDVGGASARRLPRQHGDDLMRFRISQALRATVLPTLDGPLAVEEGDVVLVAVLRDVEQAARVMRSLDIVEAPRARGKR